MDSIRIPGVALAVYDPLSPLTVSAFLNRHVIFSCFLVQPQRFVRDSFGCRTFGLDSFRNFSCDWFGLGA